MKFFFGGVNISSIFSSLDKTGASLGVRALPHLDKKTASGKSPEGVCCLEHARILSVPATTSCRVQTLVDAS